MALLRRFSALEGLSPEAVQAVVKHRRPFQNAPKIMSRSRKANPMFAKLRIGGNTMFTFRATARLRLPDGKLSDFRRKVSETVKFDSKRKSPELRRHALV